MNPAANYYFMVASTCIIAAAGTWVTERIVIPRLGTYAGDGGEKAPDILHGLTPVEKRGLGYALLALGVFVAFLLWTATPHIRNLWRQAVLGESAGRGEVISPRLAFGGLLLGVLFMIAWLTLTGLSFYVAVILVFGSLGAFIGLSRIVAEAGAALDRLCGG